jgi:hypothetical protein
VVGARKLLRGVFVLSLGTTVVRGAKKLLLVRGDPVGFGALNACLLDGVLMDGAMKLFERGAVCAFGALKACLFVGWLLVGTKRLTG